MFLILPALKSLDGFISRWLSRVVLDLLSWKLRQKIGPLWPGIPNWGPVYREKNDDLKHLVVKGITSFRVLVYQLLVYQFLRRSIKQLQKETQRPINLWWICSFFVCFLCHIENICWMTIWTIVILKSYNYMVFLWGFFGRIKKIKIKSNWDIIEAGSELIQVLTT